MFQMDQHLAVIAGAGSLPIDLIRYCKSMNFNYTVFSLDQGPDNFNNSSFYKFKIGQASKIIKKMHHLNVKNIVMVGKVARPHLFDFTLDLKTILFISKVGINAFKNYSKIGDDFILKSLLMDIEIEGFNIIGIDEIISNLFFPPGNINNYLPTNQEIVDIEAGINSSKELGKKDLGQAVIIKNGIVVGQEDSNGTDYLIRNTFINIKDNFKPILIKTVKPYQDRRVDLPVIGTTTVDLCIEKGFRGIVVEAGGTIVHNQKYVINRCNESGMFLTSIDCSNRENKKYNALRK